MVIRDVEFVRGVARWEALPSDGRPEVAFIGRSNVGKSSLLNMVVQRKALARTSGTPGKTQQLNFFLVDGWFYLVDLPGFGYARVARTERERWGRLIGRYLTEREPLRLVFHLIDSRHPPTALDRDIMALLRGSGTPYLVLLTKSDKISGNDRVRAEAEVRKALQAFALEVPVLHTSAATRRGREEVLQWIESLLPAAP
jgi:GTP-binding protein